MRMIFRKFTNAFQKISAPRTTAVPIDAVGVVELTAYSERVHSICQPP